MSSKDAEAVRGFGLLPSVHLCLSSFEMLERCSMLQKPSSIKSIILLLLVEPIIKLWWMLLQCLTKLYTHCLCFCWYYLGCSHTITWYENEKGIGRHAEAPDQKIVFTHHHCLCFCCMLMKRWCAD
ncbi:hypothetical protein Dimus_031635 [Dionaea muscipula]